MLANLLSNRGIQGGIIFFILCIVGSGLYSWHIKHSTVDELERTRVLAQFRENQNEKRVSVDTVSSSPVDFDAAENSLETQATPTMDADTAAFLSDDAAPMDLSETSEPEDFVSAEPPAEEGPVSPYGFGAYPELPEGWPANIWPRDSANSELITRVQIKLSHQGINALGGIMENGLVYPAIPGTVYVDWKTGRDGSRYISDMTGDPAAADILQSLMESKQSDFTEADIPSDIEILPFSGGGIDPYNFLDLPRR